MIAALFGLMLTAGFEVESSPMEGTKYEVLSTKSDATMVAISPKIFTLEVYESLGYEIPSHALRLEAALLKVPVYSVPLPDENKIVLVRDPKGFVERAIRHNMEFIAIKPAEKGEYWELVPVFSVEKSLSFDPKSTVEKATPEEMELLRIVPVKDFIRYN